MASVHSGVAAVRNQGKRKQSVESTCEDKPYSGETFIHQMSLRLCKYQDQYQILLLCAPRFRRKTKEEEKGFILEEKVPELARRSGCLAIQSRVHASAT